MKKHGLMATQTVHKAKRTSQRIKPRAQRPALEWLAAMCSHIPNKGEQMVRYYLNSRFIVTRLVE